MPHYTEEEFEQDFPDDIACLEWLKNQRFPDGIYCENCQNITKHHLIEARKSYSCQVCACRRVQLNPLSTDCRHTWLPSENGMPKQKKETNAHQFGYVSPLLQANESESSLLQLCDFTGEDLFL